jgi:hypothetical protein
MVRARRHPCRRFEKEEVVLIVSLIVSVILGAVVAGLTGIGFLFWVVAIFVFICSLPFVLVDGYIQDKIDYVQDREDYRESMREIAEEEKMDRYLDSLDDVEDNETNIYIDNRSIHYHDSSYHDKIIKRK